MQNGFQVIAADIDHENLSFFEGSKALTYHIDVTDISSVRTMASDLKKKDIQINFLINNAGIYDLFAMSEEDSTRLRRIFDVNFFSSVIVTSTFIDDLIASHGRVIMVSSESVRYPMMLQPYQVSKIAVEAYVKSIRQELSLKRVRVSMIRPGPVDTMFVERMKDLKNPVENSHFKEEFEFFMKSYDKFIWKKSRPEEVAKKIYQIATCKRPKLLYRFRNNPLLYGYSFLPNSFKERLFFLFYNYRNKQSF